MFPFDKKTVSVADKMPYFPVCFKRTQPSSFRKFVSVKSCLLLMSWCLLAWIRSSCGNTSIERKAVITCDEDLGVYIDGKFARPVNTTGRLSFYAIPSGSQLLVIKCVNQRSEAGILGSVDNGLATDTRWKCTGLQKKQRWKKAWIGVYYDDSDWAQAVTYFPNREWTVWGRFADISDEAYWIWTADKRTHERVYCRRRLADFPITLSQHSPKGFFQATLADVDHALLLHSHSQHEVPEVAECAKKCTADSNCKSFNFQHKSSSQNKQCELNTATSGQDPKNYVKRRGYTYYEDIGEG